MNTAQNYGTEPRIQLGNMYMSSSSLPVPLQELPTKLLVLLMFVDSATLTLCRLQMLMNISDYLTHNYGYLHLFFTCNYPMVEIMLIYITHFNSDKELRIDLAEKALIG